MTTSIRHLKQLLKELNPLRRLAVYTVKRMNQKEYKHPLFKRFNERSIEYRFVFEHIASLVPATILDVGTGVTALPSLMANCGCRVTAIDNIRDYWDTTTVNRHYHVIDDDITNTKLTQLFDLVTCISTLEHIERFDQAMESMVSLVPSGGHIILTFPYHETAGVENVYDLPGSEAKQMVRLYKTRAFSRRDIERWVEKFGVEIVQQEYWQFFSGDYWTIGDRIVPPRKVDRTDTHQLSCLLFRKQ